MTGELDYSDEAVAERVRRSNARVFAGYLVVQAVVGLALTAGARAPAASEQPGRAPVSDADRGAAG